MSQSSDQIVADLKTCLEKALDRRRIVKGTSEQWYALGAMRPSSGESTSQYGVRISTFVKKGTFCSLVFQPAVFLDQAENV